MRLQTNGDGEGSEVIVGDSGSTDRSLEVARGFPFTTEISGLSYAIEPLSINGSNLVLNRVEA